MKEIRRTFSQKEQQWAIWDSKEALFLFPQASGFFYNVNVDIFGLDPPIPLHGACWTPEALSLPLWAGETAGDGSLDGETGQVTECLAVARSLRTVESLWPVLRQRKVRSDVPLIKTSPAALGSCQNVVSGVHANDHNARSQSTVTKYRVGGGGYLRW